MKYKIVPTRISEIRAGDTIRCSDGVIRTVCANNIKEDKFWGRTIFGDPYNLGYILVDRVEIFHAR